MTYCPGLLLLLRYGNGTQAARVIRVKRGGGLAITRCHPHPRGGTCVWRPSSLVPDDARILGLLPDNDPRRQLNGFHRSESL